VQFCFYLLAGANNNNHKPVQNGQGNAELFGSPMGIALCSDQYIVVCDNDYNNHYYSIRVVNSYGVVTTIAGGNNPTNSSKDGIGKAEQFNGVNVIELFLSVRFGFSFRRLFYIFVHLPAII